MPELVAENLRLRSGLHDYDLQGRSLADISLLARTELLDGGTAMDGRVSQRTSSPALDSPPPIPSGLIYLAGHQPQMFHPGVWFKNFALGELAKRHGATAVNLIIDGDTLSDTSLRVPGGSVAEPHVAPDPFRPAGPRYPLRRTKDRRPRAVRLVRPPGDRADRRRWWPIRC